MVAFEVDSICFGTVFLRIGNKLYWLNDIMRQCPLYLETNEAAAYPIQNRSINKKICLINQIWADCLWNKKTFFHRLFWVFACLQRHWTDSGTLLCVCMCVVGWDWHSKMTDQSAKIRTVFLILSTNLCDRMKEVPYPIKDWFGKNVKSTKYRLHGVPKQCLLVWGYFVWNWRSVFICEDYI